MDMKKWPNWNDEKLSISLLNILRTSFWIPPQKCSHQSATWGAFSESLAISHAGSISKLASAIQSAFEQAKSWKWLQDFGFLSCVFPDSFSYRGFLLPIGGGVGYQLWRGTFFVVVLRHRKKQRKNMFFFFITWVVDEVEKNCPMFLKTILKNVKNTYYRQIRVNWFLITFSTLTTRLSPNANLVLYYLFFFLSFLVCLRLFQHTFGTHPQTFTNRLLARGLPGVCSGGVLQFSWTMVGCLIEVRDKRCVFHHQAIDAGDTAGMQRHLQSAKVAENARNFDGSVETKTNPRSLFVYNTSKM